MNVSLNTYIFHAHFLFYFMIKCTCMYVNDVYSPRGHPIDVELYEDDVHSLVASTVEEVVALCVPWVEAVIIG